MVSRPLNFSRAAGYVHYFEHASGSWKFPSFAEFYYTIRLLNEIKCMQFVNMHCTYFNMHITKKKKLSGAAHWSGPVTILFSGQQEVRTAVKNQREHWVCDYRYGQIVIKQIIKCLIVVIVLNLRISVKEVCIA
jgi:hypothetical protein